MAWPQSVPLPVLATVELATIAVNLGAVVERLVRRW
jgi:hypothetical protein